MSNFDNLLRKYNTKIEAEQSRYGSLIQTTVARDPNRRPWHLHLVPLPSKVKQNYFRTMVRAAKFITRHWKATAVAAIMAGTTTGLAMSRVPPTYSSAAHLFAPEKIDTIVSRLSVLTSQLEFASLPLDLKMPVSLLSRRLREEPARKWVIDQFLAEQPSLGGHELDPAAVGVDTFYASGDDLLVVQGFAS